MSISTDGANGHDFFRLRNSEKIAGESLVSAEIGSTGSLDHITEDINTNSITNPSGYLGKTSETTWMNRVSEELEKVDHDAHAGAPRLSYSKEATGATSRARGIGSSRQITQGTLFPSLFPQTCYLSNI